MPDRRRDECIEPKHDPAIRMLQDDFGRTDGRVERKQGPRQGASVVSASVVPLPWKPSPYPPTA